jgi:thiol-disulfide isomerase/thioredoxin
MKVNVRLHTYTFLTQYEAFVNVVPDFEYYSFLKNGVNDDYLAQKLAFSLPHIDSFAPVEGKEKSAKEWFAYFKEKYASLADNDIFFDIIRARQYRWQQFYTDDEKQEIRDVFKDKPAYAEALIAKSGEREALAAANDALIAAGKDNKESINNELPKVSQEKMFDAILAKYSGKVVVVDFWATWCGPCMQAMKEIKPLKEEMKGKDVVWLYLTGETSPLATWMQTYPTIAGEHYRVSEAQWTHWGKTYGIEAIPTYMIYDRKGKQMSKYRGFPGVGTMKGDIEKGL